MAQVFQFSSKLQLPFRRKFARLAATTALLTLTLTLAALLTGAPPEAIIFSPDITIVLDGNTINYENAAEDDFGGNVTPIDTGALPGNVDLQAYHRTSELGDMMVLDTTVNLPGGVLSTPRKVIGFDAGTFSEILDLADCGVPDGIQIDAMTSADAMWFSFDGPVMLGGQLYDDEDVVALGGGCSWESVIDGSALGVNAALDVDGIHWQAADELLLISFDAAGTVGGVNFDDEDVLSLDVDTAAWEMIYDGSVEQAGLEWNPADLNALAATFEAIVDPNPEPEPEVRLRVRPASMAFVLSQDDGPASRSFTVQAIGGTTSYTVQPGASWLSSNPTSGSSSGEIDSLLAIVDARGMPPGIYQRPLFVRGGGQLVPLNIMLTVTPAIMTGPPPPSIPENAAVNAASMTPFGEIGHPMSPQSVVAIFGSAFGNAEFLAETIPLPLELGGASVTFDGIPAGMFFSSQGQLLVQLPASLLDAEAAANPDALAVNGTTAMVVRTAAGLSQERVVQLHTFSPAIYTLLQTGSGQGIVVFSNTTDLVAPVGTTATSRPASAGDLLTIYANGLGPVDPEIEDLVNSCDPGGQCAADLSNVIIRNTITKPVVTIGGTQVPDDDVLFSGLSPLFVGLNEVIVRTPIGVPTGNAVPIVLKSGDVSSRLDVTIAVE